MRWCKREPRLAIVGAVALLLFITLISSGYWFLWKSDQQEISVANSQREAATNDANRKQAERAAAVSEREREVLAYYRSVQDCDARSDRRDRGLDVENRQAIARAAAVSVEVPNRHVSGSQYAKLAACPDLRPLEPISPSRLTSKQIDERDPELCNDGSLFCTSRGLLPKESTPCGGTAQARHFVLASAYRVLINSDTGRTERLSTFPSDGPISLAQPRGVVPDGVQVLTFSPNGKWLAASAASGKIHLFDLDSNSNKPRTWSTSTRSVIDLTFSSNSKAIFSRCADYVVRRWEVEGSSFQQPSHTYGSKDTSLGKLQIVPNNASVGTPESLIMEEPGVGIGFLDAASLQRVPPTIRSPMTRNPAISPDGRTIAFEGEFGRIMLADRMTGKIVQRLRRPNLETSEDSEIRWLCFSPDGSLLISTSPDSNHVQLWEVASGRLLCAALVPGADQAEFRPDGKMLVVTGRDRLYRFEVFSNSEQNFTTISTFPLWCFESDTEGKRIATLSTQDFVRDHGEVAVWNWRSTALEPIAMKSISPPRGEFIRPLFTTFGTPSLIYVQQESKESIQNWDYLARKQTDDLGMSRNCASWVSRVPISSGWPAMQSKTAAPLESRGR